MYFVLDDNNNKVEAYDKEEVLALLEKAIADGSLAGITENSGFIKKIKCCVTGGTSRVAFVSQAKYNELQANNELIANCLYIITDDTTAEDMEAELAELAEKVNRILDGATAVPKAETVNGFTPDFYTDLVNYPVMKGKGIIEVIGEGETGGLADPWGVMEIGYPVRAPYGMALCEGISYNAIDGSLSGYIAYKDNRPYIVMPTSRTAEIRGYEVEYDLAVRQAIRANSAANATNATNAENATNAVNATNADNADLVKGASSNINTGDSYLSHRALVQDNGLYVVVLKKPDGNTFAYYTRVLYVSTSLGYSSYADEVRFEHAYGIHLTQEKYNEEYRLVKVYRITE